MLVKALIVEDDANIADLLRMYLEREGFEVLLASNGETGGELQLQHSPDIILLDIMLPKLDGWALCRQIRARAKTPIIMLTAKGETFDKVQGLEMGADDYVTKPFEMRELIARVHALLRRSNLSPEPAPRRLEYDNLIVDMDSYALTICGKRVDAPPKELELLYRLASSPNRVFTRNQLLDEVWGFEYFGDSRTVDVHIKRLREKLEGISDLWRLKTVWAVGYKFELDNCAS